MDTNKNNETIDLDTGEIVEQKVPNYLNKKIFDLIKEFNIDEMAVFFCSRCKCEGQFCDFASDCTEENKHQLCVDWLSRLIE